jgi:hypothetical protein
MADKKISALTASTTPLAGTEVLPIVQGGSTVKVSVANLTAGRAVDTAALTASGLATLSVGVVVGDGSFAQSKIYSSAANGLLIIGKTGTTNDLLIAAPGGNPAITIPTGTEDVRVSNGNLIIGTAGKGIDFSAATHAAGMTSELLNDYEEGTWTPAVTTSVGSITTITTSGTYTKVGRNVTLTFRIVITNNGTGSGSFNMTGVPFAPSAPDAEAGIGRETGAVGFSCVCSFTSGTTVNLANYLGAYPGGTGYVLVGSFTYSV